MRPTPVTPRAATTRNARLAIRVPKVMLSRVVGCTNEGIITFKGEATCVTVASASLDQPIDNVLVPYAVFQQSD